jgi:hypothetical protein
LGQAFAGGQGNNQGLNAYNNSYTASSVGAFSAAGNPALLKRLILIMLSQKSKSF